MAGVLSQTVLVDTQESVGAYKYATWRKSPTQLTTIGIWFDMSMSPGNPKPQYYAAAPLVANTLARSTDVGLDHGGPVSPAKKILRKIMAMTAVATALPMCMILMDYLLFYPFIDESITDVQTMDNTQVLSRYTTGNCVQMMAVVVGAHTQVGGVTFSVNYTNQNGQSGQTSGTCTLTTSQSLNGTILTSERAVLNSSAPFIPLQKGDTGVQSVQSVTMNQADVGLFCIVLVRPLAQMLLRGIDAPVEKDYWVDHAQFPIIVDDAYLNFICCPAGSLAATPIHGDIEVIWS